MIPSGGNHIVTHMSHGKGNCMNASATGPVVVPESPSQEKKQKSKPHSKPKANRDSKPTRILPTDRIGFDKQLDILRAYAAGSSQGSKAVTLDELSRIMKMAPATLTLANPFLNSVGLITKTDSGYMPAPEVLSFLLAFQWDPETAAHKMAPIVENAWFFTTLKPKLTFSPLAEDAVIATLAEQATAGPDYRKGLKTLVEYMIAVGLIQREGTDLKLATSRQAVPVSSDSSPPKPDGPRAVADAETKTRIINTTFAKTAEGAVHFNVNVRIDMEEFKDWRPERIAAFFSGIAEVLKAKSGIETEGV
jgi:hypothetical protein